MIPLLLACVMSQSAPATPTLAPARQAALVRSFRSLQARGEIEKHAIAALPVGARFVRIDVSDQIRSKSFGHSTTLLVPAGFTGHPQDPNRARSFYVEYGPSTNAPGGRFGPFRIVRQKM